MLNILISNVGFGNASPNALVTLNKIAHVKLNDSGIRFDEIRFLNEINDVDVLIAGTERISENVIAHANKLKLIARVGVGVDNLDLKAVAQHKINVCYTPTAPGQAIPEFTLGLMLNLIKNQHIVDRAMRQGKWLKPMGSMLSNHHVGIVGAGTIGGSLIKLLRQIAPGIKISFYDPNVEYIEGIERLDLTELVRECSIISLHLPLNESTHGLFNRGLLNMMRPDSYLINTSRGGIVDENALFHVLKENKIAAAAIDVYEQEPYTGNLITLENCLLSSHIGSLTHEVRQLMEDQVADDVINFCEGKPLVRPLSGFEFYLEKCL
jgi:D-3-phosphoglycerate dehydrogenase